MCTCTRSFARANDAEIVRSRKRLELTKLSTFLWTFFTSKVYIKCYTASLFMRNTILRNHNRVFLSRNYRLIVSRRKFDVLNKTNVSFKNYQLVFSSVRYGQFKNHIYLLLTEFEGRTVSYGPSFFLLDLWPNREARGP